MGDAAESAGFEDVPANHTNADDIDCIAYYGITKGTGDGSTYSPSMSVTREHMALFLTRLAKRVGIEMASNPSDAGFTDIGELSAESQTAINQLADLDITMGTGDGSTYSPAGSVTRGQMALFIDRLMDKMTPYGGDKSTDAHTPSDVDNEPRDVVGSPFTDLGRVTKEAFDAITALYELGVASGINDTHYGPAQSITRAAMAGFMAGVMGHSNLRPAGLSIQASVPSTFGVNEGSVVASVRDDSFAAVADQTVEIFGSDEGAFDEDGVCKTGTCTWNDGQDEQLTDEDGNIVTDGGAARGKTHVYYAWIGTEDDEKFDVDETDHVSVSVVSKNEEQALKVTTSINENADGETVDLDRGGSVTVTVQLVDTAIPAGETDAGEAADGAKNVARSGIEISVGVKQETDPDSDGTTANTVVYDNRAVTTLTTDEDGKATFVVDAPKDDDDKNDVQIGDDVNGTPADAASNLENRTDTITFTYKAVDGRAGSAAAVDITIHWKEDNPVTTSASGSVPTYVIADKDGDLAITASLTLYDQYGNGIREGGVGQQAAISIGSNTPATNGADNVNVNRNGVATRRVVIKKTATNNFPGAPISVGFTERPRSGDPLADQTDVTAITETAKQASDTTTVQVVTRANDDDVGEVEVNSIDTKKSEFLARDDITNTTEGNSYLVYSYDSGDTFVNGVPNGDTQGELLTLEEFEDMLDDHKTGGTRARVDVIVYKPDGDSIFKVTIRSAPPSS